MARTTPVIRESDLREILDSRRATIDRAESMGLDPETAQIMRGELAVVEALADKEHHHADLTRHPHTRRGMGRRLPDGEVDEHF